MKKLIIILAIAAAALLVISQVFKAQIGARIFSSAANKAFQAPFLSDLPDGLHVLLIGTGSPLADPSRAGPSTAVIAGKRVFIIDSGGGSVRKMSALGLSPAAADAVLLTHFHSDHIDGLGELMLQRWAGGGYNAPLPVYGPKGTAQITQGLNQAYSQDRDYRIAHHGAGIVPPAGFGAAPIEIDMEASDSAAVIDTDGLKITAFTVDHAPVSAALGYRFDYKGRSVVVTGDTAYDARLADHAKDVDILLSEALNPEMTGIIEAAARKHNQPRIAKIMSDIPSYHITPVQAAELAEDAGAKLLVLTHIVPALPSPYLNAYFTQGAGSKFSGDIITGQDGMLFSLPQGSRAIDHATLK